MIAVMYEASGTVITAALELQVAEEVPRGSLIAADGRPLHFTGWTELAAAIETWREEAEQSLREST
jgi:hypothetical protein